MQVVKQLARAVHTPGALTSLTRRDNTTTSRIKREIHVSLIVRTALQGETCIDHVYSHLLDEKQTMEANTRNQRLHEMEQKYGRERYEHVLLGNAAADRLATQCHANATVPAMPITSVMDPEYVAYSEQRSANSGEGKNKRSLGEDIRRTTNDGRRATEVDGHKKRHRHDREQHANTLAKDNTSLEFDETTDMRQSARVMQEWRGNPEKANASNFLYRARRGAILEKSKAFHRIDAEKEAQHKPLFTPNYGSKYAWNVTCPCCQRAVEQHGHVLTNCPATQTAFRQNLRKEVIDTLKKQVKPQSCRALDALPAWFACGDDTVRVSNTPNANKNKHLLAIATYDKDLGTLAYIPTALIEWLRQLEWKTDKTKAIHAALLDVHMLLATRAHTTWIERCNKFEEQWREERKRREQRRKEEDERERQ
jgi:hypothetical protein